MKMLYSVSESFWDWDVVPEIDQHQVRYSAYTLKSPQNPKIVLPQKRKYLLYMPDVHCEFDDESDRPNYANYVLPNINTEPVPQENNILTLITSNKKEDKVDLSLDFIYSILREIKISTIRKIIKKSKNELLKIQKNHPSKESLSMSTQFVRTMFNPDQIYCIHMSIRETLNVPPHLFKGCEYIYRILVPEAAIIIFKNKFKLKSRTHAVQKLVKLELLNQSFYKDKAAKDIYCLT